MTTSTALSVALDAVRWRHYMSEPKSCPTCGGDCILIGEPEGTVHYQAIVHCQDTEQQAIHAKLNEWFVSECGDEDATQLLKMELLISTCADAKSAAKHFYKYGNEQAQNFKNLVQINNENIDRISRLRTALEGARGALEFARKDVASWPHSFGYSITSLPKIDKAIAEISALLTEGKPGKGESRGR